MANESHCIGDKTPLKDGVSQNFFLGGKYSVKIDVLGAGSFFDPPPPPAFLNLPNN